MVDNGLSYYREPHRAVESIGDRVWRVDIDFADHAAMAAVPRLREEIFVKSLGEPLSARSTVNNDTIDVDERVVTLLEPVKVGVIVGRVLIECDQERRSATVYAPAIERMIEQRGDAGCIEKRCFIDVCIIERKYPCHVGQSEILYFLQRLTPRGFLLCFNFTAAFD